MHFPDSIFLSKNFFNAKWSGHRRMKNVIVALDWIPQISGLSIRPRPSQDYGVIDEERGREQLDRTLSLVSTHQKGFSSALFKDVMQTALSIVTPEDEGWSTLLGDSKEPDGLQRGFYDALVGNALRQEEDGRYTVMVSLLEAETLRRVIHLRSTSSTFIENAATCVGLNLVPSNFCALDQSVLYKAPLTTYVHQRNFQCLRFFDCDLHYTDQEFALLLRSVHANPEKMRQAFFQQVITCRRRSRQRWEQTPISLLFVMRDAFTLLHQRSIGLCVRRHLENIDLNLGDAFMAFNSSHSGILSPDEVWGSLDWCGMHHLTVDDVLDFIDVADTAHEGTIQYPDFLSMLTGNRELEEDAGGAAPTAEDAQGKKLPTIAPLGSEELKAARTERIVRQRQQEAEANREMESENMRVMDEIEAEQIAEEIRQVDEVGNPLRESTALTFSFVNADSLPRLIAPYGGRVRRSKDGDLPNVTMQSNSGLRLSLRLLKKLLDGKTKAENYTLTVEFRLPKPQGDKRGSLKHLQRIGRSLNLFQWALPMYRFGGYNAFNMPPFEVEVFGAIPISGDADDGNADKELEGIKRAMLKASSAEERNELRARAEKLSRRKKEVPQSGVFGRPQAPGAQPATDPSKDGKLVNVVHIFKEPRPGRSPDDAIGQIKPQEYVVTDGQKTNNAVEGVTYEWMHIVSPVEGWVAKEKNGRSLWEHLGTNISVGVNGFVVDQSIVGNLGSEHVSVIDESTEEETSLQAAGADQELDDEDNNPVELTADVGDLLEAIRRAKKLRAGDKVTRNRDCWEKGNEDGGAGKVGKVLKVDGEKVQVQWPGGNKGTYEWGYQGRFELIKVGEADSDDEGEEREVMNDERWLVELRKGGQKCHNCNAQKLEPGNWFRCNHCENYHLCKKCFRAGQHADHDFTDMGVLSMNSQSDISPGAQVRIKLSVLTPKYGWLSASPGLVGFVLEVDFDENCATVELADGSEWKADLSEIEMVKDSGTGGEDMNAGTSLSSNLYRTVINLGPQPKYPFVNALVEVAKKATLHKFKVGDTIKVIQGRALYGEVRTLMENKTYGLSIDGQGFVVSIPEKDMTLVPLKVQDRVRIRRGVAQLQQHRHIDIKTLDRTTFVVQRVRQGQDNRNIWFDVVTDEGNNYRLSDLEIEVFGNGKWTLHKYLDVAGAASSSTSPAAAPIPTEVIALPTSSNVVTERAFQDGQQVFSVFIKDDTYVVDFETLEVKRGPRVVGKLSRDPSEPFIKGEAKKELDDGNIHIVSLVVKGGEVTAVVDGKPMPLTFAGVLVGTKERAEQIEVLKSAMPLLTSSPLYCLYSPITPEMAKAQLGPVGNQFPARVVNWIRVDWSGLSVEEVKAWHQGVDAETAWECTGCKTRNSRLLEQCGKCKQQRVSKKSKSSEKQGKFRSAAPKSRESAMVRNKLQAKLRAQYQKELDVLDEAAGSASKKESKNKGVGS